MDEYDPMAELGLIHDKQLVLEPQGFLVRNNMARELCDRFIPDGAKLYDLIDRYDNVTANVLNRDDTGHSADVMRMIAPFLKAFGASDFLVQQFCDATVRPLPEAETVMSYFLQTLPTYVNTMMYRHSADAICTKLHIPPEIVSASELDLDGNEMNRQECRDLRQMAVDILALPLPQESYVLNVPLELSPEDVHMISVLDDVFLHRLSGSAAFSMIEKLRSVGANEKAYTMLEIRKQAQVDLDGTAYIGGETIDYQVMDLIKDSNGLALAFNGSEFAVHGANIAVLADDCTAAAVLVEQFYNEGIEAVFDLVEHWSRKGLEKLEVPDRNLVDTLLLDHPKKLPEVYRVTRDNVNQIAAKSDAYRRKLLAPPTMPRKRTAPKKK